MPTLLIHIADDNWVAEPANSGIQYTFSTIEGDQEVAVQQLAAAMQQGEEALVNGVSEIFEIPQGVDAEQVVQTLFNTTDTLTYIDRIIYGVVGEEMLLDDIVQAGEALALAL
jgi:hypothetical protein